MKFKAGRRAAVPRHYATGLVRLALLREDRGVLRSSVMNKFVASGIALLAVAGLASAQGSPSIVWSAPTPGLGTNSVQAAAWSPTGESVAVGSSDRWFRLRLAADGALLYSLLEPKNSGGPGTIMYSLDAQLVAVRNQSSGLVVRVQRMVDGLFVGSLVATVGSSGLLSFTPDATLVAFTGDGTLSNWDLSQMTFLQVTGSGYLKQTTTFNVSPDGTLQTAALNGTITVRRTSDAAVVAMLPGRAPVTFSPDGSVLAARADPASAITLWHTADWSVLHQLTSPHPLEVVGALRFGPDGQRLAVAGYEPFLDMGLWQQKGFIRLWSVAAGTALVTYDQQTSLAVTSEIAWSPDGSRFVYGLYDGTVAVAQAPAAGGPAPAPASSIAITR